VSLARIESLAAAIRTDADLLLEAVGYSDELGTYAGRIEANAKTIADLADRARRDLRDTSAAIDRAIREGVRL
jgi:hypothetical protein